MPLPFIPIAVAGAASLATAYFMQDDDKVPVKKGMPVGMLVGASVAAGGYFVKDRALRNGIMVAGGGLALKSLYNEYQRKEQQDELIKANGNDPAYLQAMQIYGALHDVSFLGYSWMIDYEALRKTASEITCWEDVKKFYSLIANKDIGADLQRQLNQQQLTQFYAALERNQKHLDCGKAAQSGQSPTPSVKGLLVITKANTNARFAPRRKDGPWPIEDTRIHLYDTLLKKIHYFEPNTYLGRAVREVYDPAGNVNFTLVENETSTGRTYLVWVANSQIDRLKTAAEISARKPKYPTKAELDALMAVQNKVVR